MRISGGGKSIIGGVWTYTDEINVDSTDLSSITFSGLDGDDQRSYALEYYWLHAGTGVRRLDLRFNGAGLPGGSVMARRQQEVLGISLGEDRVDPDLTVADLVGAASGTFASGTVAMLTERDIAVHGIPIKCESFSKDAALLLGDRFRFTTRQGIWASLSAAITSVTLQCNTGSSIKVGSFFRLYRGT